MTDYNIVKGGSYHDIIIRAKCLKSSLHGCHKDRRVEPGPYMAFRCLRKGKVTP